MLFASYISVIEYIIASFFRDLNYKSLRIGTNSFYFNQGYKNIMENCLGNAKALKEGLEKTGRFDIISKDFGVPLVAFSLKDSSKYTVFQIAQSLKRFGWIVPAYTMPPDAEHIDIIRVVIREDFNRSLSERLASDIEKVVKELDELPPLASNKEASVTAAAVTHETDDSKEPLKRSITRKIANKKTSGVC